MELQTPVELPASLTCLESNAHILCLGSCFAQEVGSRLVPQFPEGHVVVNPFGPMYSPTVIATMLRAMISGDKDTHTFQGADKLWHSWLASSICSSHTQENAHSLTLNALHTGREALLQADMLILTFGTTRYYTLKSNGMCVSNCHKEPASTFSEVEPTLDSLCADWQALLQEVRTANPHVKIVLTVSPYRYRKYGMHTSQLQKAKLLLLCDALNATYFPSYEIMQDELRDYRFYAPDMLHPTQQAVDIIAQRFRQWCFSESLAKEADERMKAWRKAQHRPLLNGA